MRAYGKIETAFWQNAKIKALSERARMMMAYLLSCPHGNSVGCFVLPMGYIMADHKWDQETVCHTVSELVSKGHLERCEETDLTRIIGWWGHNTIENPKVAIGAIKTIEFLPHNTIVFSRFIQDLKASLGRFPETVQEQFRNGLANRMADGIETKKPEPEPEPKPEPKPEPTPSPAREAPPPSKSAKPRPAESPPDDDGETRSLADARSVIAAFDASRTATFGEAQARPWPAQDDLASAKAMLATGATPALCRQAFDVANARLKGAGHAPRDKLKAMLGDVTLAMKPVGDPAFFALPKHLQRQLPKPSTNLAVGTPEHRQWLIENGLSDNAEGAA